MTAPFRLIVFDLDGTLVDTRRDLAESANTLIGELGGLPLNEEVIGRMVGTGVSVWLKQALTMAGVASIPANALDRFIAIYDKRLLNHTQAYEGMPQAIERLAAVAELAVLTNKMRQATVKILEGLGLSNFFTQIGGVDGPYPPKPAPDGLQAFMQHAAVGPSETVLVGDSPIDLQTARNADTQICLARYGFGYSDMSSAEFRGDELFIDRPGELPDRLGYTIHSQLDS
jgi:phosphoglycolate phosphatase